ncbi:MAG: hypothetical protein ABA06_03060 [Parcubacteria bacterium C7867-001]|nr:MAG: hypothetical protein ABA06_03060 [Parcubacteria bacterium C7867-001]
MYSWKQRFADAVQDFVNVLAYILIFLFLAAPIIARGMHFH